VWDPVMTAGTSTGTNITSDMAIMVATNEQNRRSVTHSQHQTRDLS
jgi:hypothetical protein